MKKGLIITIPAAVVAAIGLSLCTTTVKQGHVGAVYDKMQKGVQEYTLSEGIHFVAPWQTIKQFPVSIETVYMSADDREGSLDDDSVTVSCSDGSLNADLTFSYRFDVEDVPAIQKKYRGKDGKYIINSVLRGQMRTWVSEVTKNYTTMEVHLTNTAEVNSKLTEYLNEKAKKYGVTFENVSLAETRASNEVQAAIEKRQQIAQELEQQKLSLEKAEVAKEQAQLEAEKKLIEAEGERKANEELSKGLTDKILEQQAIEKWDGVLPTVTDGQSIISLK